MESGKRDMKELLMGYIDGELDDESRESVERELAASAALREELEEYRRLADMTESLEFIEPTETEWRAHWEGIYNRLERGVGWVFLSLGCVILLLYGAFRLLKDFLLDGGQPVVLRVGVGAVSVGVIVLGVSVVRERIRLYKVDRYEEVEL